MKSRNNKQCVHSAMDNYQCLQNLRGWDPVTIENQDIFKQLKNNLNKYQRKYNQSKEKMPKAIYSQSSSLKKYDQNKENTENTIKLPVITSAPLKNIYSSKQPFALKNRNLIEDSRNYSQQSKNKKDKCTRILKLIKIRKSNISEPISHNNFKDICLNFDKSPIKQKQINIEIKTQRKGMLCKRITNRFIDYDFSDSRLIINMRKTQLEQFKYEGEKQNE